MDKVEVAPQVVVEKDRIADPAPLGLAGFAVTTFVACAHFAGWTQDFSWIGMAFFYGGLAQFLAGMWEFKRDNTFGATAFSTYGAFWLSIGLLVLLQTLGVIPPGFNVANALGWTFMAFFIFNAYMTICALLVNVVVFAVFFLLTLTELCLFVGLLSWSGNWVKAGGYLGIFTSVAAFYGSFSACFNAIARRQIIYVGGPLLNLNKGL